MSDSEHSESKHGHSGDEAGGLQARTPPGMDEVELTPMRPAAAHGATAARNSSASIGHGAGDAHEEEALVHGAMHANFRQVESATLLHDSDDIRLSCSEVWNSFSKTKQRTLCVLFTAVFVGVMVLVVFSLNDGVRQPETMPTASPVPTITMEDKMLGAMDVGRLQQHLIDFTQEPHMAGSPEDERLARMQKRQWEEWGLPTVDLIEYHVMLTAPLQRSVTLTAPVRVELQLREAVVDEDTDTQNGDAVPTFNGYGAAADLTAPLVYANYGRLEDFDALRERGIDVEGRVVIVRYGRNNRGIKVMIAQERGCAGVLIYSDPKDDGEGRGEVYPAGPWRPESGVQRGSTQFISIYPGDPTTPGVASVPGLPESSRLAYEDAIDIPHIPVQPLSWGDAKLLLERMGGHKAGELFGADWVGGIPGLVYRIGSGVATVELKIDVDVGLKPIWNVVGKIPGAVEPDRAVLLGNHRDAWVFGAVDPHSGTAPFQEVVRAFGARYKEGWRPRRTLYFCSWDAEEFGLIGSTEWVEDRHALLSEQAVAYLNVDMGVSGANPMLSVSAVPSLGQLFFDVAQRIPSPNPDALAGTTLYDDWLAGNTDDGATRPFIAPMGSGSDFSAFIQYAGIASADFGFDGDYGVYHSRYDDYHWFDKFGAGGDGRGYRYMRAIAQLWALAALRLADDAQLPLDYTDYGTALVGFVADLDKLIADAGLANQVATTNLINAVQQLREGALETYNAWSAAVSDERIRQLNNRLVFAERGFLGDGLPGRETFFKHEVFAPGLYAGYAADTFPGVRDAIRERDVAAIHREVNRAAQAVLEVASTLKGNWDNTTD